MPATPAWPPQSAIRLFVEQPLSADLTLRIDGAQAHYLISVMRLRPGGHVQLFDDATGEWLARAIDVGKRDLGLQVVEQLRAREPVPDLWLGAAPIRRARYDWVAEKACELGVARFTPVMTRRAMVDRVNPDRLRAHMVEAAEQCGRTALPMLDPLTALADWLALCRERTVFFADETGGVDAGRAFVERPGPAAILIGPEGGFDPAERDLIRARPDAVPIALGPRILRADTAAVAAMAAWMTIAGDWRASSSAPGR